MNNKIRCCWCGTVEESPLYVDYHDNEWGRPVHDDRTLFEFLILEGAQAGLSWYTVLKKRENYRAAFDNFDPTKVAAYDETKIAELLTNEGIIRNRLKVHSVVRNAKVFLEIAEKYGSFDKFIWNYVDGKPTQNAWKSIEEIPATTDISDRISKDLKKLGMNFVGSTIIYSFMQATGMVNDHLVDCFVYAELTGVGK
jgi:DNA-3-methyladenine glycosylase I